MNCPYIISEVGSNWLTFSDCIDSILQSKIAGADAVKFQLFTPRELYGVVENVVPLAKSPYLDPNWLPKLKEHADACGIDFMCTAFSLEGLDLVDPHVNLHKIASAELSHVRMLEKVALLGKPVILSTGASGHSDIEQALQILKTTETILLYCIANYPARETDLERISILRSLFGRPVGFSDHSLDIYNLPRFAVEFFGASVIEKHFTLSHELPTADVAHSLDPIEFGHMVGAIRRGYELSRQRPPITVHDAHRGHVHVWTGEERDMIIRHNRRLIVTKPISPGDVLRENINYGIYRSQRDDTHAHSPFVLLNERYSPEGKIAKHSIPIGFGLGVGDY